MPILICVFIPFLLELLILTFVTDKELHWEALTTFVPMSSVKWGTLASTVIWAFGAFDVMGVLAGSFHI